MHKDDRFDFSKEDGAFRDRLLSSLRGSRVAIDDDEIAFLNAAGAAPGAWSDAAKYAKIATDEQAT